MSRDRRRQGKAYGMNSLVLKWILIALFATLPLSQVSSAAAQSDWVYSAMPATTCREGASAGIAIRRAPKPTNRIVIVMQGGGFCADSATCSNSPKTFDLTDFSLARASYLNMGIFYRFSPNNPFANYHQVYIPYCSGDLHAGKVDRVVSDGTTSVTQHHRGAENTRLFYERIVSEFRSELQQPGAEVMLAGVSAGGYGVSFNAPVLSGMLPSNVRLITLNDSGPALDVGTTGSCFSQTMADYFNFRGTFLSTCPSCGASNWLSAWQTNVLARYPRMTQALISSSNDGVISKFISNGFPGCSAHSLAAGQYEAGLRAVRKRMQDATRIYGTPTASFFISESDMNTLHVWTILPNYYGNLFHETRAQNAAGATVLLRDWAPALYDRLPTAADHVGLP
jgi:hypothetical protein